MVAAPALPYFPRGRLIEDVAKVYASGLKQGVTLFAPRRHGKTAFVEHELTPFAEEELGWRVIYIDLWARRDAPELALVEALEAYIVEHRPRWKRMRLKQVKAKAGTSGASLESTFEPKADGGDLERRLAHALTAAVGKDPTLLVLDEVQALAETRNTNFVAALRTALQAHRQLLRVFYTGSSRDGLNRMFRVHKAPLFESAMALPLPTLKDDFVDDRLSFLRARSRAKVDRAALTEAFEQLGRTPEYLNEVVLMLLIANDGNVEKAMAAWRKERKATFDADLLKVLRELDRAVLDYLATQPRTGLYSDPAVAWLTKACQGEQVTTSRVQAAVRKLVKRGLVAPTGTAGEYEIEDRSLLLYLRDGTD